MLAKRNDGRAFCSWLRCLLELCDRYCGEVTLVEEEDGDDLEVPVAWMDQLMRDGMRP